jgi:hypothetical protein
VPGTSLLSGRGSALGKLKLGAGGPRPSTATLQYRGPFRAGQVTYRGQLLTASNDLTQRQLTVDLDQLDSIRVSDPTWWEQVS